MPFNFQSDRATVNSFAAYIFYPFLAILGSLFAIPYTTVAQCPTIAAIAVNACGTEQNNEYVVINSGGGFFVSDLQFDYDASNNAGGAANSDINIGATPCGLQVGNPSMIMGCNNVLPVGPGFFIPANSYVILETSSATNTVYDFTAVCGTQQCVYVIQSSCARTLGAFTDTGAGTRTQILKLISGCSSSYTYNISLIPNANGAYFIPPATYGSGGCVAPPVSFGTLPLTPTISGIPASICQLAAAIALPTTQMGISGNWSGSGVSANNFNPSGLSGNITLTFTPAAGQCATVASTTINVTLPATPVITGIPATICQSASSIALPTTQSGITGNWSGTGVSGNNFNPSGLSGSITLTFTPTAGLCANSNTTSINVNVPVTPAISGIPATICELTSPIALPTTQSGITGNWSGTGVSGNNFNPIGLSGNITLTFTPTAGQCANLNTTTINVTPAVTPAISGIPATICQLASSIALPTTQSGITGNWSGTGVSGNNFNPIGLSGNITLTFTPTAGQCANVNTTSINVTAAVTPAISGIPATICQLASSIALPTTQSGITGNWSGTGVSGNNFDPSGLSGNITLTFTPTAGQCANVNTASIDVTPAISPAISGIPSSLCQTDSPVSLPTTQSGVTGNWSGTGVSGNNFNPSGLNGNITLTFTPTAGQCAIPATTNINVNIPMTPVISGIPATICQSASSIALPTTQSGIMGNWSGMGVAGNNFNPAGLSGNITLTFTPGIGQCANSNTTSIDVNLPVTPLISGIPGSFCQNDNTFSLPTTQSGITGNWSGSGVAGNNFDPSGLSGNITLTFIPSAGQCANNATTTVNVTVAVTPVISGIPASLCQLDSPVSLPTTQSGITGTWSGMGVAGNNFNPAGLSGNITLTFTPGVGQCANAVTTSVTVNIPVVTTITTLLSIICQLNFPAILVTTQGGITGNWSGPGVVANTFNPAGLSGPITLTFTPNAGQCATTATGIINVNVPVVPVITGVPASICQTAPPISLPTILSGVPGSWSGQGVSANNFDPTGLSGTIILTFSPTPPQCALSNTTTIIVNTPVSPVITGIPSSLCENDASIPLPTTQSGITGDWSGQGVMANNFDPTGLSGNITLTFTPNAPLCAIVATTIIMVNTTPTFTNLNHVCNLANGTYTITFDISGGTPGTYTVNGLPVGGSVFTSGPITSGTGYTFNLDDGNGCGPVIISGLVDCSCATSAGTMDFTNSPLQVCDSSGFVVIHNGNELLDFNDVLEFVLHTNPGAQLGTIISISSSSTFPYPPNIIPGQVYYASAVAGNNNGSGGVNLNDPCLSVSQGIPVIFYVPTLSISGGGTICQGDCFDFQIQFNGFPPFNLNYTVLAGGNVFMNSITSAVNSITISICPADYGISNGQIQLYPNVLTDANCIYDFSAPATQILTVHPNAVNNITQTLCPGQGIIVNGTVYDQVNPTGTELLQNAGSNGCDSTVNVNLSFYPPAVFNLNQTLCTGGSVIINGTVYDASHPSGTEILINGSVDGCDSTINVSLTFNSVVINNINQTLCPGDSIVVNGTTYNSAHPSGSQTFVGGSYLGCDSVVNINLSFYPISVYNLNQTLCTGGSIIVNGTVYDAAHPSGTEVLVNADIHGCDSTVNVNLTFNNVVTFNLNATLCTGDSIVVNGTTYNSANPSGSETFIGGSYLGCDSVVNINLSFYPQNVFNLTQTLCSGEFITVNGTVYDQGHPNGMEVIQNTDINGCDSIVNVSLTFHPVSINNLNQTLCPGKSITVNGTIYNAGHPMGVETINGGNHFGCDSIINVNLSFYPLSVKNLSQTLCPGTSITVNGTVYNQAHPMGTELLPNASSHGCDSTVNVSLTFYPAAIYNLTQTLCVGGSLTINGTIYDQNNPTGTEIIPNASVHGCDSTINVNLTFNNVITFDLTQTLCPGDSIIVNGTTYNEANPSGSETFIGGSYLGCDSVVNVNLTFYQPSIFNLDSTLQQGQTITVNGTVYSETNPTGVEVIVGGNYNGCDSTIIINLNFGSTIILNVTVKPPCSDGRQGTIDVDPPIGGVPPYIFKLDDYISPPSDSLSFSFNDLSPGFHLLTVVDSKGTKVMQIVFIPDPVNLTLDLGSDQTIPFGQSAMLSGQTNFQVTTWLWSPPDFLDCTDCAQPNVVEPTHDITYTLVTNDSVGCTATDYIKIFVSSEQEIYVPTTFSPNGDGINDVLTIFGGAQVSGISFFRIFDRWGNQVFEINNILPNDESKGWDGSFKGDKMQPGVYVWLAEVVFPNGNKQVFSGDLTLLR